MKYQFDSLIHYIETEDGAAASNSYLPHPDLHASIFSLSADLFGYAVFINIDIFIMILEIWIGL
ncbi:MAG: hypothetical protein GF353_00135 [Candidatus Lokiarchaeota archaeon]|nr:hypothetical protein [Candidatus Lokiarchaeota archaeon]